MDCDQRTPPCSGSTQSSSGISVVSPAVTHSPPPTSTSTSPVAMAVWLDTTSPICLADAFMANSFFRMAGRSASVKSAVFLPSPMATMPMTGR